MIIRWKEWSFLFVWSGKLFAEAFELPETVVEEERWRERGDEVRVEAEEWEGAGVVSVPDLLENVGVPVVSAFGDGWSGSPSLRGYSGDRGNRVAILLDGLPVNRPDLAVADWGQLPLNGLEEVRVVRGSRTVRYGSLASGGVIELRSGRSREEMEVALEGFGGSDETWGGSFSVKVPGEWVAMEVSGNTFETEAPPAPGGRESESLRVTLHGPDWDWLESRWTFGGGETFFEFPGGLTYEEFRRNPRMGRGTDFAEIESWEGRQLLEVELGEWELGSVLSWREEERMLVFGDFFYDQSLESWDGEWVVRREGEKFDVEAGVRWRRESLRTVRESRTGVFLQDAELVRMSGAVFAIGEWDLGGGFAFRQGVSAEGSELEAESVGRVRDDNYDESDRVGEWAAETALEWKGEGLRSWVRYERVYRFPLLDEIAGYQGAILPVAFNRDLGPERGHGMEWGFEGDWGEWEVGGTVFGTWLEGEIGFDGALNVNLAETERFGGEVWVDWERDWLRAGLRYGWTEARFRDGVNEGKDLPLVPQHALTGHVEAEVLEGLKLRGGGGFWSDSFQADDFENVRREIPERVVFNLGLSWALREDWTVFARVSNVLDRASARYAAEGLFYPAAGRQWVLGARMEF